MHPQLKALQTNKEEINVGDMERVGSALLGAALIGAGLKKGTPVGFMMAIGGGSLLYRGMSGHCALYSKLDLSTAEPPVSRIVAVRAMHGVKIEESVTINRRPEELYRYWRRFENLPRIMRHLVEVKNLGGGRSRWVAKAPMGMTVEWEAVIHSERPDEMISWRSLAGSDVDTAGSVHFEAAPGGRGTILRMVLKVDPPAGKLGAMVAKLFGEAPDQQIRDDLRRFKAIMEAGEQPTVEGPPMGLGETIGTIH